MDILITNCTIYDGTGAPAYRGSVGFSRGVMHVFRGNDLPQATTVIDASGLALVPGFVDAHSHGDLSMASPYATLSKLNQGITTQIAGQCGASLFPACSDEAQFSRFVSGIAPYPDLPENRAFLASAKSYFEWLETLQKPDHNQVLCWSRHATSLGDGL